MPITAFILLDKMITPFFMLYGITYLPYRLIVEKSYAVLIGWYAWLIFSRFLKLIYYFGINPQFIVYLPIFVLFQYVQAIIRIWALITINERKWGTKGMTVKGGVVVNDDNDLRNSKNYINSNINSDKNSDKNQNDSDNKTTDTIVNVPKNDKDIDNINDDEWDEENNE